MEDTSKTLLWCLAVTVFGIAVVYALMSPTSEGERYVLYHRPGCPACAQFLPRWSRLGLSTSMVNTMMTKPPPEVKFVPTLEVLKGNTRVFLTGPQLQQYTQTLEKK